jgi:hypothetical protein
MRVHLAGIEELYSIALYAKAPFDREDMVSEDAPKTVRIEITYERDCTGQQLSGTGSWCRVSNRPRRDIWIGCSRHYGEATSC